jgi:FkbM family methyltransferase
MRKLLGIRSAVRTGHWLWRRFRNVVPPLPVSPQGYAVTTLGSDYGGWSFFDDGGLRGGVILSCGLGEDASFDVEFAARYGATVIMIDPTPRAIQHFRAIQSRVGVMAQRPYSKTGAQPVDAYELRTITGDQLRLVDKALWTEKTQLKFFAPANPAHVSHSIVNYQNNYATDSVHIDVQSITIDEILHSFNIGDLKLLKLDIEGAEIEVIIDMLSKRILPRQILVEYDELSVPSRKSKRRVESCHDALVAAEYRLIHRYRKNFVYYRQNLALARDVF